MSNRRALVTGAASGIGRAAVVAFLREGAEVIAADIAYPESDGDYTREVHLDVANPDHWKKLLQHVGPLDALVACAGVSDARSIGETSLDDWRRVIAVNLDGVFLSLKYGAQAMQPRQGGTIVVVGSASGVKAVPRAAAYCSSKAGVRMLVKAGALELKAEGIRVNSVSPAGVVTPMWRGMPFWKDLVQQHGTEEGAWNALGGADPLKPSLERMALPDEIAEAIVFLSCDQSAHITGADLAVDAGYSA
jgi:NAD(P)-dependent dehydrogenase (short-subunit alcohol dehydrogenase family)